MKVLLLESDPHLADQVAGRFQQAGHEVLRCHDADAPAFPCKGVDHAAECPFDHPGVAVSVVVRAEGGAPPTPLEDGVSCSLRHRVPVVVGDEGGPYEGWATPIPGDIVEGAEQVARGNLEGHAAAVHAVVAQGLARIGVAPQDVKVDVRRTDGDLAIALELPVESGSHPAAFAAARAVGAARQYDRYASRIDVRVSSRSPR